MKKCLVLGGTGFLGRWLVSELLRADTCRITLYSRNADAEIKRFAYPAQRVTAISGSFGPETDFHQLIAGCDVVFHLISTTVPGSRNVTLCEDLAQNAFPTARLLDACVAAQVKKVVYFSSGGTVYGPQTRMTPILETAPTDPICSYGIQKLLNEKILQLYTANYGLDSLIIRLANPYGPYQNPNGRQGAVASFTWRILQNQPITIFGDGENVRDYIDVRDAVRMVLQILECPGADGIYNVGSGVGTSLNQIVSVVETATGKRAQIIYSAPRIVDVRSNVLSIDRYLSRISSERPRSLEAGIQDLVRYYRKAGFNS